MELQGFPIDSHTFASVRRMINSCKYSHHIEPVTPVSHSGVEKKSDDEKRHYFSSDRHDAVAEIVHADERLEN